MDHNIARKLRQLGSRFALLQDWLITAGGLKGLSVAPFPDRPGFYVTATWLDATGTAQHLTVSYGPEILRAKIACTKDLGRRFLREVLRARGVLE